ncbi:uncharacterized protein BJX67DRAFT_60848 [Aspergillus lucknowensis]|uniref:Uncharacterized protein n=1 Tax=Aspergillus lucknowensis TaxID=176173 RepID=A0ABR4LU91_9EURO
MVLGLVLRAAEGVVDGVDKRLGVAVIAIIRCLIAIAALGIRRGIREDKRPTDRVSDVYQGASKSSKPYSKRESTGSRFPASISLDLLRCLLPDTVIINPPLQQQKPRMKNKPRISITLHPRGKNSLGENRQRLHYAAYHWGILISPKDPKTRGQLHTHCDVTDSLYVDPLTGGSNGDWRFRERTDADPDIAFQILVRVTVCKVRSVTVEEVVRRLREIQLPRKGGEEDGDNCVRWTREAVEVLSQIGLLRR